MSVRGMFDARLPLTRKMDLCRTLRHDAFIAAYNDRGGFGAIARFHVRLAVSVAGGSQLMIEGSTLGYQFPALKSGGIVCPEHGYSNSTRYPACEYLHFIHLMPRPVRVRPTETRECGCEQNSPWLVMSMLST